MTKRLPGVEVSEVPEIRDAARSLLHIRADLAETKQSHEEAIANLLSLLRQHKMESYRTEKFVFSVKPGDPKLAITTVK